MSRSTATPLTSFTLEQLRTRTSEKWCHYEPDVLPLWVAEMDSTIAPAVTEVLQRALDGADTGYATGNDYGVALGEFAQRWWNWTVDERDTIAVIDVMRGIADVIRLASEPEAPVIITPPVYHQFAEVVNALGRPLITAPLDARGRLDPESLELACAQASVLGRGGVLLLCNPHNPTGVVHTRVELEQVADMANRHGLRLVADEIHAPLVHAGHEFVPVLSVDGAEKAIVVTSASKSFNLAGLKAGLIVGGPASRRELNRWRSQISNGASHWGMIAHSAAYRGGDEWLADIVTDIQRNSSLLSSLVSTHLPGAVYQPIESTYLAWVDCRALGLGDDPAATFLTKGRVAFSSGPVFGSEGAGFVRINIATSPDILTEALTRAGRALG